MGNPFVNNNNTFFFFALFLLFISCLARSITGFSYSMSAGHQREEGPSWCPEQQIYINGVVPDHPELDALLQENGGALKIFGYGSLCWGPGEGALAKEGVTTTLGRAIGYKRCWAQKSADHRGTPQFPGIVVTILTEEEVNAIRSRRGTTFVRESHPHLTEGVIYTIPPDQVDECLAELDFREKGVSELAEEHSVPRIGRANQLFSKLLVGICSGYH
jgi:cation transport regulator ChaC